jgi:hypothetical protein
MKDTSSAKFKANSRQLPASLLGISAAIRELWCMNHEYAQYVRK